MIYLAHYHRTIIALSSMAAKQSFRPFTLAFIQLGQTVPNKADNLKHARDMILKAVSGQGHNKKPDLVVLPVRY